MIECPSCRQSSPRTQSFCGSCGRALGGRANVATEPVGVEERKLATVLFADVVGFTALSERTDHEVVARMADNALKMLGDVVNEHGGTVDKFMGDSVMAVFGVPMAHDDDAERAVAAGLAMREQRGDLAFSIGINSGEVTAASVGRAGDFTVIGDTVNVAARLEETATAGEVLCGRLTVELARSAVAFRQRAPVVLKGKREPVEVWEALGLRPETADDSAGDGLAQLDEAWSGATPSGDTRFGGTLSGGTLSGGTRLGETRLAAATGGAGRMKPTRESLRAAATAGQAAVAPLAEVVLAPLIGRADELAFLESRWRQVCRDGRAQVVLLCGDAGYGKTRIASELLRVAEAGGIVVWATYPAYGSMGGNRVAADVVRQLGPSSEPEVNARVRSLAGEFQPSLSTVDPSGLRQEQIWAFRRLIEEKSQSAPIVVAIDDMHRSGDNTLDLLNELASRADDVRLLTVLCGRTSPSGWLERFPQAARVPVGPLGREDSAALADAFAGEKPLGSDAAHFLVSRANGNPLYLRELVTMAKERGLLVDAGDRWALCDPEHSALGTTDSVFEPLDTQTEGRSSGRPTLTAAVPATLQALLAARLDLLEPEQKLAIQYVAVMGETVTAEQIGALASHDELPALRSLANAGLLRQMPDGRYDIVDPLLREVAYETLPRHVRGELHRRAAVEATSAETKARHLDRAAGYLADDTVAASEAAEALADAGEAMIAASRHLDGMRLLERAVARGCVRNSALLALARTQALCGRTEEALQTLSKIEDDASDPSIAIERDHTAANSKTFTDPAWAIPRLQQVTDRWMETGNREKEAWARANAGVAYFYLSRMDESAPELERALEIFEDIGNENGIVATASFLCLVKPTDKRVPRWLEESLEFTEQAGDRSRKMTVLTTLAWHQFFRSFCGGSDEVAGACATARGMAELAEQLGASDLAVHGWSLRAVMSRLAGDFDNAAASVAALERVGASATPSDRWLAWAATFSVTVAKGEWGSTPPFPPDSSPDPVTAMARLVIQAELTLSGRVAEAVERFEGTGRRDLGPIGDLGSVFYAIALVLSGRGHEALLWVDRTARAAEVLEATSCSVAASALRAEITMDLSGVPPPPAEARDLPGLLLLRAHSAHGDTRAGDALRSCASRLAMPALSAGVNGTAPGRPRARAGGEEK